MSTKETVRDAITQIYAGVLEARQGGVKCAQPESILINVEILESEKSVGSAQFSVQVYH